MGNVCCGTKEEERPKTSSATFVPVGTSGGVERSSSTHDVTDWSVPSTNAPPPTLEDPLVRPRSAALAQSIVQATGRSMVSIHTRRTDRHYYSDQGFAAALAQHLQERMPPADKVTGTLPPAAATHMSKELLSCNEPLNNNNKRRNWSSSSSYLDQVSEAILERAVPKPERLFAKAPPMMENLL